MINNSLFMQAYLLLALVVCGLVQYLTGVGAVLWLPFIAAFIMVLLLVLQTHYESMSLDGYEQTLVVLFVGFCAMVLSSTLLQNGIVVTIVGFKNELALALVFLCLLFGFIRESQLFRVVKTLYWVFYIQFPVILYQILIVVPHRVAVKGDFEKWDSVVGTFGGDPLGGGNTAALGLFCLLIMLLKLSEFRHGVITRRNAILHILAAFMLCILGEVKFVILLSPILMMYVWLSPSYVYGIRQNDLKKVLLLLGAMVGLLAFAVFVLAATYAVAFDSDPELGALKIFLDSLQYIYDPDYVLPTGELGRMTTLFFWLDNSQLYGWSSVLFGYGLNATNHGSSVAPGFLNTVFNVLLDSTSLSMMLWEFGLIGSLLFLAVILVALKVVIPKECFTVDGLSTDDRQLLSWQPAFVAFTIAGIISLPYSQILMLVPMLQFLFYFSLGASLVIRKSVLKSRGYL
ncbi:capsular biosynthesis protein [Vibrio mediterranei]|uniref:capsular biosynthesis protein n=1 Tax=Vibrio mediterranei TaxID=689 RepID=UPI0022852C8F|nr:capsular biosynthesis protein [Vibrio mediterranei]MCY9855255.1 capsular biosynthesis protein [Vibrio mediterranei]